MMLCGRVPAPGGQRQGGSVARRVYTVQRRVGSWCRDEGPVRTSHPVAVPLVPPWWAGVNLPTSVALQYLIVPDVVIHSGRDSASDWPSLHE